MENTNHSIALFIDADNAPAKKLKVILSELAKFGSLNIRKAYGNWESSRLKGWKELLHEHAIQPIQQYDLVKGKNATDMAIAIDAMDILYTKQVDAFCIVSSDCDFAPLAIRLIAEGKKVFGFGERKTPAPFTNACSTFLFLDEPEEESKGNQTPITKRTGQELKCDTKLMNLIRNAIEASQNDDGWASLGAVGSNISNQTSFDSRNYGYKRLGDLLRAIDLLEVDMTDNKTLVVRDKRKA